jgi:SH3-like domain-containing protein
MARRVMLAAALTLGLAIGPAQAQDERATPYWASISAGKAMMRTGPGQNYPATWLYVRADLPIQVVETYPNWRKIRDSEGTTGWMLQRLLSDRRTGLVKGDSPQPLRKDPAEDSPVRYLAEPGVVGRISKCTGSWCLFQVGDRQGYIRQDQIWGVKPGETLD